MSPAIAAALRKAEANLQHNVRPWLEEPPSVDMWDIAQHGIKEARKALDELEELVGNDPEVYGGKS